MLSLPHALPHINKGLFKAVPFTWYIMSSYQEKIQSPFSSGVMYVREVFCFFVFCVLCVFFF